MLIGELASRTGVSTKTLRFYEDQGLLCPPARTSGGYRTYEPSAIERVAFIRRAQEAGLTLRQIGEVLEIRDDGRPPCDHVARLVDDRLAEVELRLAELTRVRDELHGLRSRLAQLDTADCTADRICTAIGTTA